MNFQINTNISTIRTGAQETWVLLWDCGMSYRIIEWFGLERIFKITYFQPPCYWQGHFHLDQVAQSPIQPGLEYFQRGGIHNLTGWPVPVSHHPHCKEFLPLKSFKKSLSQPSLKKYMYSLKSSSNYVLTKITEMKSRTCQKQYKTTKVWMDWDLRNEIHWNKRGKKVKWQEETV